jgi:flagellar assembly protein FliH
MQIVADPLQTRGGCRVLTDTSQIDASVEARLNAVIAHVLGGERSSDGEAG